MTRVAVDCTQRDVEATDTQKVGEIISRIVADLPQGRFVAEIELDGRTIRHFLPDSEINRPIKDVQHLVVRTADRAQWTANGFDIALSSLERIQKTLIVSAELFREANCLEGNRLFARCMDGLERFWEAVMMTRSALGLDFKEIAVNAVWHLSDLESQFLDIIKGFVVLQDGQQYDALADKIEFELIPHLSHWVQSMHQLRAAQDMDA